MPNRVWPRHENSVTHYMPLIKGHNLDDIIIEFAQRFTKLQFLNSCLGGGGGAWVGHTLRSLFSKLIISTVFRILGHILSHIIIKL